MDLVINCAPQFDVATKYSFMFNRKLMDYVVSKGVEVLDLLKDDAVREKVQEALKSHPYAIFVHYNHGVEDKLIGQDSHVVINLDNVKLLKGREAYNMNCLSAKVLGVEAFDVGCKAYWGYVEEVYFTTDALEVFEECFNFGFKLRVDGKTWMEALEKTKEKFTEYIDLLVAQGKAFAALSLRHDRDCLVCYDGGSVPEEKCRVSRFIQRYFGRKTLRMLRKIRRLLLS